jgi:hypothetical protein
VGQQLGLHHLGRGLAGAATEDALRLHGKRQQGQAQGREQAPGRAGGAGKQFLEHRERDVEVVAAVGGAVLVKYEGAADAKFLGPGVSGLG